LANGKSGDWWLNLAGDVGGEPSETEAHFSPMHVRKFTIPLRYSGEDSWNSRLQLSRVRATINQPNSFVRHVGIARLLKTQAPAMSAAKNVRCPCFEGVCPHARYEHDAASASSHEVHDKAKL
jgi:hypothetical protein